MLDCRIEGNRLLPQAANCNKWLDSSRADWLGFVASGFATGGLGLGL